MEEKQGYNVVLRNTKNTGFDEGLVRWRSFKSKEAFKKWYTPEIKECQTVVEEGVSEERAIELAIQTPFACRIASAIKEATDPDGNVWTSMLQDSIEKALYSENNARERLGLPHLERKDLTALMVILYFL